MIYFSNMIVPIIISIVLIWGLFEKKKAYDLFCEGAKDGISITLKMFPTLIGIFIAIGMFRSSGLLNMISKYICFFTNFFNVPNEIIPLALIRPISGSASIAMATDLMKTFGTDTRIGMIAAAIMGSSETTFYIIAIYTNAIGVRKTKKVIIPSIMADLASIITAILILK